MCSIPDRREAALRQLPPVYVLALRLRDAGLDQDGIALCVGVETVAVEPLLELADAKLAAVMGAQSG